MSDARLSEPNQTNKQIVKCDREVGGKTKTTLRFILRTVIVNDTEPTQRGRGLFTEGSSRREIGAVSTTLTLNKRHPE